MPSGGKGGPAPRLDSATSEKRGRVVMTLPPGGYEGPVPEFPLESPVLVSGDDFGEGALVALERIEARRWAAAWRTPQAAAWAAEPWRVDAVAAWVRVEALVEAGLGKSADRAPAMRLREEIGLTTAGLARNGWVIGVSEKSREEHVPQRRRSSRDRASLKVVAGGRE